MSRTTPAIGDRFTCTSKTLRNTLSLSFSPAGVETEITLVTTPSAGETTKPGPLGTTRSGSRKNHRKKAASSSGEIAHHQPPVNQTNAPATSSTTEAIQISVTYHKALLFPRL